MKSLGIKLLSFSFLLVATMTFFSCEEDEVGTTCDTITCDAGFTCVNGVCVVDTTVDEFKLSGSITADKTLDASNVWTLEGRVIVESGATLTIDPGTVIKGQLGVGAAASSLVIARGATINAVGTAENPIVFTSEGDNIISGSQVGTSLNYETQNGLWGGLIILGDAPISPESGNTSQIEGIPADVLSGNYGGNNPTDNSGTVAYVSIRFGGAEIGAGNEINGLTLGGVGSGTTIHHVEIVSNFDDGIEFFGGTVNVSDAIVVNQGDDAFDVDQAWSGTLDNYINIAGSESDFSLEIDGPEGSENATGRFNMINGTLKGGNGSMVIFKKDAQGNVGNTYFFNYATGSTVSIDDDSTYDKFDNGLLTLGGLQFNEAMGMALSDIASDDSASGTTDFVTYFQANCSVVTSNTEGADASEFTSWSLAGKEGLLSGF
ncbi:MAG: hypothetical protein ACI94Y_000947 [Maribacter sp.]|jgi:hypothetical protein